ncbi:MAG: type IV pilus modification PilV family protein [Planctomycetota bacterium]|jgi:type II secretory pathway pseudopilin PulG
MHRKLIRLFRTEAPAIIKSEGFTITEVVIATSLLIIAIVPILKALTSAQVTSAIIERRTHSLTLAQTKLDEIKARSIYDYSSTYTETSTPLDGSYLCDVKDTSMGAELREIEISVGYDLSGNSTLESNEIEITLTTLIANRW